MKIHVHQHYFVHHKLVCIMNIIKKVNKDNLVIIEVEMKMHQHLKRKKKEQLIQQQEIMQEY